MFKCNVCGCASCHPGVTEEVFQVGEQHVMVEAIPARICDRCGEANFSSETAEHVRKLLHGRRAPKKRSRWVSLPTCEGEMEGSPPLGAWREGIGMNGRFVFGFLCLLSYAASSFAVPPDITSFANGSIVWSNSAPNGYSSVEWASSLTGTWYRTWQWLRDIEATPGEMQREVPMFYRVAWSANPSTSSPPSDVSSFIATPMDGRIGLSWSVPIFSGLLGVRIVRDTAWYPSGPSDGQVVYEGGGNSSVDNQTVNGVAYYYKAFTYTVSDDFSMGVVAAAVPADMTPPANVSGLTAVAGDHQVSLHWQNPVGPDFVGVKIVRTTVTPPTGPNSGTTVYSGLGTNAVDTGLSNGTVCYYKAYSFDIAANYSTGSSALATPMNTLPPDNVGGFTATSGNERTILNWNSPSGGDYLGVRIQRKTGGNPSNSTDGVTVYTGSSRPVTNLNLINGTEYFFTAFSYDEIPNYSSGVSTSTIPADVTPPGNVTGFSVVPVSGGILLNWTNPPDADFAGVRIQRKTVGYPTNSADGFNVYLGSGTNIVDSPMTPGVNTNFYRVFPFDEVPNYLSSATGILVRTPNVTGFRAVAGDQQVILSWTNPVGGNFAGVQIQRNVGITPSGPTDGQTIYAGTGTSVTNAGLVNQATYFFGAFCYDATPNYAAGVTTSSVPADTTSPGNVTQVSATPSNGTVQLLWTNPGDADFAGTRIQRKVASAPTNFADGVTVYDNLGTSYLDQGLVNGSNYFYRLFAHDEVPVYASGVAVTSMPLRILFTETFEDAGGWTDHTNTQWSQTASSGGWSAAGSSSTYGFFAISSAGNAHSGSRYLKSYGGIDYLYLPPIDNPAEIRVWCRTLGFATSESFSLQYFDGFSWYTSGSVTINGDVYTNVVFRPLLMGHPGQQLRLQTSFDSLYFDDIQVLVAP